MYVLASTRKERYMLIDTVDSAKRCDPPPDKVREPDVCTDLFKVYMGRLATSKKIFQRNFRI